MGCLKFCFEAVVLLLLFINIQSFEFCGKNYTTPTEGFKHKMCVPGHYDGSCLLLFSKPMTFMDALTTCRFEYGGRLATADSEIVFKKWIKRIYRDLKFQVKNDTRFWIGYGNDLFYEMRPGREPNFRGFWDMNSWNRTFNGKSLNMALPWEDGARINLLNNDPCSSTYATVFNPNNAKFNIRSVEEKNPFLCETPRYPKFKCSPGWHFNPNVRMCILVGDYQHNYTFVEAVKECRKNEAIMLVLNNIRDVNFVNAITALHGLGKASDRLWSGIKLANGAEHALDGSSELLYEKTIDLRAVCNVIFGKKVLNEANKKVSFFSSYTNCVNKWPFICQRFVDQAFSLNVE